MNRPVSPYFESPPAGRLARFLWFCAGADARLLEVCPHSDQVKYQGLGGVVLATAVLAFFSGFWAFYTVFLPKSDLALSATQQTLHVPTLIMAVFFGALWGTVIFNLDRFVVSSAGKGDGREGITAAELRMAAPRLFLAVIIALTISKPLEIRIMQSEIDAQLELEQQNHLSELNEGTEKKHATKKRELIGKLDVNATERSSSYDRLEKLRLEIQSQRRIIEQEVEGSVGSGVKGHGPAYRDKKENLERMEAEFQQRKQQEDAVTARLDTERDRLEAELAKVDQALDDERASNVRRANSLDGLVKRIQLAHQISPVIGYVLTLLFIMVEIAPILFKLMLTRGAYDFLEVNQKLLATAQFGIELDALFVTSSADRGKEVHDAVFHDHKKWVRVERKAIQREEQLSMAAVDQRADELHEEMTAERASRVPPDAEPEPDLPDEGETLARP